MRKRSISIITRLNEKEKNHLTALVKRSGADYFAMMKELHAIGNNLNQLARKAHQLNVIDVEQYDLAVKEFENAVTKITEAVILPKPMDK